MERARLRELEIDCISLIIRKTNHEITPEEFYAELILLDRKYPDIQPLTFKQAAENYIRHYHKESEMPSWVDIRKPTRKQRMPYKDDIEEVIF